MVSVNARNHSQVKAVNSNLVKLAKMEKNATAVEHVTNPLVYARANKALLAKAASCNVTRNVTEMVVVSLRRLTAPCATANRVSEVSVARSRLVALETMEIKEHVMEMEIVLEANAIVSLVSVVKLAKSSSNVAQKAAAIMVTAVMASAIVTQDTKANIVTL